jgi:hypothetical protein
MKRVLKVVNSFSGPLPLLPSPMVEELLRVKPLRLSNRTSTNKTLVWTSQDRSTVKVVATAREVEELRWVVQGIHRARKFPRVTVLFSEPLVPGDLTVIRRIPEFEPTNPSE